MMLRPYKCPHCGALFSSLDGSLIRLHNFERRPCPGSGQHARNAASDMRPLWKDEPAERPAAGPTHANPSA